jgi:hypothetical protein
MPIAGGLIRIAPAIAVIRVALSIVPTITIAMMARQRIGNVPVIVNDNDRSVGWPIVVNNDRRRGDRINKDGLFHHDRHVHRRRRDGRLRGNHRRCGRDGGNFLRSLWRFGRHDDSLAAGGGRHWRHVDRRRILRRLAVVRGGRFLRAGESHVDLSSGGGRAGGFNHQVRLAQRPAVCLTATSQSY